jgi:hypothetical protein
MSNNADEGNGRHRGEHRETGDTGGSTEKRETPGGARGTGENTEGRGAGGKGGTPRESTDTGHGGRG